MRGLPGIIRDGFLAALFLALGWSLRGQFGHQQGALIPGALAAAAVACLADAAWRDRWGLAVILGSLGFSLGGHFGYGRLVEEILRAPGLYFVWPKLLKIFLIGSLWGGLGASFLGFAFSEKPFTRRDTFLLLSTAIFWLVSLGLFNLEAYDLMFFGIGFFVLHSYNKFFKESAVVSLFGAAGLAGFGGGFLGAVLLQYAGSHGLLPGRWPWWSLRDQFWGAAGGMALALALGALHRWGFAPDRSGRGEGSPVWERAGLVFFLLAIPLTDLRDALLYWKDETKIISSALFDAVQLSAGGLGVALIYLAWKSGAALEQDRVRGRVLCGSVLVFMWGMSVLACAKQLLPYGFSRWEAAFTLFFVFSAILSVFVPFRLLKSAN